MTSDRFARVLGSFSLAGVVAEDNARYAKAQGDPEQTKHTAEILRELQEAAGVLLMDPPSPGLRRDDPKRIGSDEKSGTTDGTDATDAARGGPGKKP